MYSILVVDDEPDNFDVIETLLTNNDYTFNYASSGQAALGFLEIDKPDVILLDVMMPGMDGIELCRKIRTLHDCNEIPIIILTALTAKQSLADAFEAGADDFISKPVSAFELRARVKSMLKIHLQHQQLLQFNKTLEQTVLERTNELHQLAYYDQLTTLPNRSYLIERIQQLIDQGKSSLVIFYLDCDNFKMINSSFGHTIGDQLLKAISQRLLKIVMHDNILVRTGEDEFCFLVEKPDNDNSLYDFIDTIQNCFCHPFLVSEYEMYMTVSIGVATSTCSKYEPIKLLQDADTAMYQAKTKGKGSFQFFVQSMSDEILKRLTLENELQRAVANDELVNYYQPIVNLRTREICGFEALVRWIHPDKGVVSPGIFIPALETTGLIVPAGLQIFEQACRQLSEWHCLGWNKLFMSINLSVKQFASVTLVADICKILGTIGVDPNYLKLEITESAIIDNSALAISILDDLRKQRIAISLDDFGTGYSSLAYLHKFPIDNIKIDQTFIRQLSLASVNYHIVETIISLAGHLGMMTIAEGIETEEQVYCLAQMGCQFGQGYYFAKPNSSKVIESTLLEVH